MQIRMPNEQKNSDHFYYPISVKKFTIMNLCTGGIYLIFWFYKSWNYIQQRDDNTKFGALVMALLSPIFFYPFIKDVNSQLASEEEKQINFPGILAFSFFIINLTWKSPDPYWLLSVFSFLFVIPVLKQINNLNKQFPQIINKNSKFYKKNYLIIMVGLVLGTFVCLSTFNFIPSTHVIPGSGISNMNKQFLRENGLLEDDETIIYFYSDGIFSIEGEGNFFTNNSVVSYENQSGELYGGIAYYNEIDDIKVEFSNAFLDDTIITIIKKDGTNFMLIVPAEEGLDRVFVSSLLKLWKNS